jgi:hypothetical protein
MLLLCYCKLWGATVDVCTDTCPLLLCAHRNPVGFPYDRHYETNGWFYVDDALTNLMKNRYVITMPLMGMPVSPFSPAAWPSVTCQLTWAISQCLSATMTPRRCYIYVLILCQYSLGSA